MFKKGVWGGNGGPGNPRAIPPGGVGGKKGLKKWGRGKKGGRGRIRGKFFPFLGFCKPPRGGGFLGAGPAGPARGAGR